MHDNGMFVIFHSRADRPSLQN